MSEIVNGNHGGSVHSRPRRLLWKFGIAATAVASAVTMTAGLAQADAGPFTDATPKVFGGFAGASDSYSDSDLVVGQVSPGHNAGVYYRHGKGGGAPNWGEYWREVPGGLITGFAPAVTRGTSRNYVVVPGQGNPQVFETELYMQVSSDEWGGPVWNPTWQKVPGGLQTGRPAKIAYNKATSEIIISAVDNAGKLHLQKLNTATDVWSGWQQVNLPAVLFDRTSVAVATVAGHVALAAVGADKRIYVGEMQGSVAKWTEVGGNSDQTPALAVSGDNYLNLVVVGTATNPRRLYYQKWAIGPWAGGVQYAGWTGLWNELPGGGHFRGSEWGWGPSVSTDFSKDLHVYHGGTDNAVWSASYKDVSFNPANPNDKRGLAFSDGYQSWQKVPGTDLVLPPPPTNPTTTAPTVPPTTVPSSKPDLRWDGTPSISNTGRVTMKFRNNGGTAGAFRVSLFFNNANVHDLGYTGMAAGGSDTISFETSALVPGQSHNILVNLDSYSAVSESNEGNNEYHFTLNK